MARDVDLLISFKNSLANSSLLSDWNHAKGVCEFRGIACKAGYVSSLTIRELPLGADFGSVSAHILSLPHLETLSLQSINLTGSISAHANCTTRLKRLDLSSNHLRGSVSDTASLAASCTSLQSLNLSNNSIGQAFYHSYPLFLPNLKIIDLSYNKIATNKDIQWLFSNLGILKHLDLSNNNIKGSIPQISNCTFLQYLDLSSNQLSGTVSAGTFSDCHNITYLNISSNHFTGIAPPDVETSMNLVILSLSNNNFSGEIPISSLVAMPGLQLLELAFNNFSGSLPNSI
ncbi:Receptor-like protein kinase BRI1-like 3 [Rhynchospora pubera]|uniref:Receptor-like protein kinase BRI1-like 3 n=1 Tax=Rhynchospora pubera TaxID=906938 RepID=A0AAV8F335_9POAL|nr:Receptor-like protein kinase BRI1-like 3 [Rhynchospora pubera]